MEQIGPVAARVVEQAKKRHKRVEELKTAHVSAPERKLEDQALVQEPKTSQPQPRRLQVR